MLWDKLFGKLQYQYVFEDDDDEDYLIEFGKTFDVDDLAHRIESRLRLRMLCLLLLCPHLLLLPL